jgi:RimJ/RimL family protein N-acetyltransferase
MKSSNATLIRKSNTKAEGLSSLRRRPPKFDCPSLVLNSYREHGSAELSFWVGEEDSGKGYITEAGIELLRLAFDELHLNRVGAHHMVRNIVSGKVLAKLGMRQEGCSRQMVRKWGVFEDVSLWAVLRNDLKPG